MEDAFLQVPQERPLGVNLRGEECLVKRNLPGQVGAIVWFDVFTEYLAKELNYKFSAECPHLGRNEKTIILIRVECGRLDFHRTLKVHQRNLSTKGSRQI